MHTQHSPRPIAARLALALTALAAPAAGAAPLDHCAETIDAACLFSEAGRLLDILDRVVQGGEVDAEEKAELIGRMRERVVASGCHAQDEVGAACAARVLGFVRQARGTPAWQNASCARMEEVVAAEGATPALTFLWASACHAEIAAAPSDAAAAPAPEPQLQPATEPALPDIDARVKRCHEAMDDSCLFHDAPELVALIEGIRAGDPVGAAAREVLEAEYRDAVLAVGCEGADAEGWDCAARALALVSRHRGTPLWNNRYCWGLQQRIAEENSPSAIYLWASACRFAGVERKPEVAAVAPAPTVAPAPEPAARPAAAPEPEPAAAPAPEPAEPAREAGAAGEGFRPTAAPAADSEAAIRARAEAEIAALTARARADKAQAEMRITDADPAVDPAADGEQYEELPTWDKNVFIEVTAGYIHLWATKNNKGPFTGVIENFTLAYCFRFACLGARGGTLQMINDDKGEVLEKARLNVGAFFQVGLRGEKWMTYVSGEAGTGIDLFFIKAGVGIRRGFLDKGYFSLGASYTSHFQGWPGHGLAAEAGLGFSW